LRRPEKEDTARGDCPVRASDDRLPRFSEFWQEEMGLPEGLAGSSIEIQLIKRRKNMKRASIITLALIFLTTILI